MRAYVLSGEHDIPWTEVEVPEIGPNDALFHVTAVATCTTDLHFIQSDPYPTARGRRSVMKASASSRRSAAS